MTNEQAELLIGHYYADACVAYKGEPADIELIGNTSEEHILVLRNSKTQHRLIDLAIEDITVKIEVCSWQTLARWWEE